MSYDDLEDIQNTINQLKLEILEKEKLIDQLETKLEELNNEE